MEDGEPSGYAVCGDDVFYISMPFSYLSGLFVCCGAPERGTAVSVSRRSLLTRPLSSRACGCVWLTLLLLMATAQRFL